MFFPQILKNFQGFQAPMGTSINTWIPPISNDRTSAAPHMNNNLSVGFKWKPQVCFLSSVKRSYQS